MRGSHRNIGIFRKRKVYCCLNSEVSDNKCRCGSASYRHGLSCRSVVLQQYPARHGRTWRAATDAIFTTGYKNETTGYAGKIHEMWSKRYLQNGNFPLSTWLRALREFSQKLVKLKRTFKSISIMGARFVKCRSLSHTLAGYIFPCAGTSTLRRSVTRWNGPRSLSRHLLFFS
jgi:hypothetical protein